MCGSQSELFEWDTKVTPFQVKLCEDDEHQTGDLQVSPCVGVALLSVSHLRSCLSRARVLTNIAPDALAAC